MERINEKSDMLNQSLFTYFFHKNNAPVFNKLSKIIYFDKYILCLSEKTEFLMAKRNNQVVGIIGLCVDSRGELVDIPQYIIHNSKSIDDLINIEGRFAGKYVLLYIKNGELYIIGDATCSIQINYSIGDQFAISSSAAFLAEYCGYQYSKEHLDIRKASDVSQAMPNDITVYKEIKQLLPNYYLDVSRRKSYYLDFRKYPADFLSVENTAEKTVDLINNITSQYVDKYDIVCPLTSGKDSRVVLAFLKKHIKNVMCYTLRHFSHQDNEPDLLIPKALTEELELPYIQIKDEKVPSEVINWFDNHLGKHLYSRYTLTLAYTIKKHFSNKAIVNGDIIGQIGKSSLHRNLPEKWANVSYFMCKLHNYSKEAKDEMKIWFESALRKNNYISIYDLFSWEIRLGRWAAQTGYIYNTIGIPYLNIFNCRDVIYIWTKADRNLRQQSELHKEILKIVNPELLKFPFSSEKNMLFRLAQLNDLCFYLASYVKHWLSKILFIIQAE